MSTEMKENVTVEEGSGSSCAVKRARPSVGSNILKISEKLDLEALWGSLIPKVRKIGRLMSHAELFRRKMGNQKEQKEGKSNRVSRSEKKIETDLQEDVEDEKDMVVYTEEEKNTLFGIAVGGMVKFGGQPEAEQIVKRGRSKKKVWGFVKLKSLNPEKSAEIDTNVCLPLHTVDGEQPVESTQQNQLKYQSDSRYSSVKRADPLFEQQHGGSQSYVCDVYSLYVNSSVRSEYNLAGQTLLADVLDSGLYSKSRVGHRGQCQDNGNQTYTGLFHLNVMGCGVDVQGVLPCVFYQYTASCASILEAQSCEHQEQPSIGRYTPPGVQYQAKQDVKPLYAQLTCYIPIQVRTNIFYTDKYTHMGDLKGIGQTKPTIQVNIPHIYTCLKQATKTCISLPNLQNHAIVHSIQTACLAYRAETQPSAIPEGLHLSAGDMYTVSQTPSFHSSFTHRSFRPATSTFHQYILTNHAFLTSLCVLLGYSTTCNKRSISKSFQLEPMITALQTRIAHSIQLRTHVEDVICQCESIYLGMHQSLQKDVPFHSIHTVKQALQEIQDRAVRRRVIPVGMLGANLAKLGLSSACLEHQCVCQRLGMIGLGPNQTMYENYLRGNMQVRISRPTAQDLEEHPFLHKYSNITETTLSTRDVLPQMLEEPCLSVLHGISPPTLVTKDMRSLLYTLLISSLPSLSYAQVTVHPVYILFVGALLFSQLHQVGHTQLYKELSTVSSRIFTNRIFKPLQLPSLDASIPLMLSQGQAQCIQPSTLQQLIPTTPIKRIDSLSTAQESQQSSIQLPASLQPEDVQTEQQLRMSTRQIQSGEHIAISTVTSPFQITRANISLVLMLLCNYMIAPLPPDPQVHEASYKYFDFSAPCTAKVVLFKNTGSIWQQLHACTQKLPLEYVEWQQFGTSLGIPTMVTYDRVNTTQLIQKHLTTAFLPNLVPTDTPDRKDRSTYSAATQSSIDAVVLSYNLCRQQSGFLVAKMLSLFLHARMLQQCPIFRLPATVQFRKPYPNSSLDPKQPDFVTLQGSILVLPTLLCQYNSRRDRRLYKQHRNQLLSNSMQVLGAQRSSCKRYFENNHNMESANTSMNESETEQINLEDYEDVDPALFVGLGEVSGLFGTDKEQNDEYNVDFADLDIVSVASLDENENIDPLSDDAMSTISITSVITTDNDDNVGDNMMNNENTKNNENDISSIIPTPTPTTTTTVHTIPQLDDQMCYNIIEDQHDGNYILGNSLLSLQQRMEYVRLRGCDSLEPQHIPYIQENKALLEKDVAYISNIPFHQKVCDLMRVNDLKKTGFLVDTTVDVDIIDMDEMDLDDDDQNASASVQTTDNNDIDFANDTLDIISIGSLDIDQIDEIDVESLPDERNIDLPNHNTQDEDDVSDIDIESIPDNSNNTLHIKNIIHSTPNEIPNNMDENLDYWDETSPIPENIHDIRQVQFQNQVASSISTNSNALLVALSHLTGLFNNGMAVTVPSTLALMPISLILAVNQIARAAGGPKPLHKVALLLGGASGQWHGHKHTGRRKKQLQNSNHNYTNQLGNLHFGTGQNSQKRKFPTDGFDQEDQIPVFSAPAPHFDVHLNNLLDLIPMNSRVLYEMVLKQKSLSLHAVLSMTSEEQHRLGIHVEQNKIDILNAIQQYKSTM